MMKLFTFLYCIFLSYSSTYFNTDVVVGASSADWNKTDTVSEKRDLELDG